MSADELFGPAHVAKYVETDGEIGYLWRGAPTPCQTDETTSAASGRGHKFVRVWRFANQAGLGRREAAYP